jgi:hypothetical protein
MAMESSILFTKMHDKDDNHYYDKWIVKLSILHYGTMFMWCVSIYCTPSPLKYALT